MSEEDVCEAAVVEDVPDPAGSLGTGADVFAPRTSDAVSGTLYSLPTRRKRLHDSSPTEHLTSSADRAR